MPKLKNYGKGKRINIWVPERLLPVLEDIDNHSKFFQQALEQAVGVMTYALLHNAEPDKYKLPERTPEQTSQYNAAFPLDPLTAKRKGDIIDPTWQPNSANKQELW